ncbi:MAG: GNAT family N-acetyltransferase [Woeseiaceae bacterium]
MNKFIIRSEESSDIGMIWSVTEQAFAGVSYASGDEQDIVDRLRDSGALSVSLVATIGGEVVGHIAMSPTTSTDSSQEWLTLGPVSVLPDYQRKGIGSALIRQALTEIREQKATGCILVGDPKYYARFGFELAPQFSPQPEYASVFMVNKFSDEEPSGALSFHRAFGD